jgi:hypothetical protein
MAVTGVGVSLALDPSDPLLEVLLRVGPSSLVFERELLRLGGDAPALSFSSHLIGHADCYRPALAFLVDEFPDFFLPPVGDEAATSFEGAICAGLACISPASRLHLALDESFLIPSPAPPLPLTR